MLNEALTDTLENFRAGSFEKFSESLDPDWIQSALVATGKATVRRRRLPAEQIVWLVLGMALLRDRSIRSVAEHLRLAIAEPDGTSIVAPSALSQARARLGEEPMEWLFHKAAALWGHASADRERWCGLAVYGVDGTKLFAADTPSNCEEFGKHTGTHPSAFPLVRVVALLALRSRMIVNATVGSWTKLSEVEMAQSLWKDLPDRSLAIVDRGFFTSSILTPLAAIGTERHWLTRAKANSKWEVIEQLAKDDLIVEMKPEPRTRKAYPGVPERWRMRAVTVRRKGHEPQVLLTSMLDAKAYPAAQLSALYHERWELELMFDDLKTEQLQAATVMRSQTASGVRQELWGALLAHNLVRLEIERIATRAKVSPLRISFIAALRMICDEWSWATDERSSPGTLPKTLASLERALLRFVLPPRRSDRSYPRAVKIAKGPYPTKASVTAK